GPGARGAHGAAPVGLLPAAARPARPGDRLWLRAAGGDQGLRAGGRRGGRSGAEGLKRVLATGVFGPHQPLSPTMWATRTARPWLSPPPISSVLRASFWFTTA